MQVAGQLRWEKTSIGIYTLDLIDLGFEVEGLGFRVQWFMSFATLLGHGIWRLSKWGCKQAVPETATSNLS